MGYYIISPPSVSYIMAPKKSASSSGAVSVQGDAPVPFRSSQVKWLLKRFESHVSGDIFISLPSIGSPNNLGLGPAFLESVPSSFSFFYPPLSEEFLKHQKGIDLSKICSSNTIISWPAPSNEWIKWVNRLTKVKSSNWGESGILHAILLSQFKISLDRSLFYSINLINIHIPINLIFYFDITHKHTCL